MSGMPWFRFFPSEWLAETRGLSAAETGVCITLIALMHERGDPIPEDCARLSRLCGASNSAFKKILADLVEHGTIVRVDGGLWNPKVGKEQSYQSEKSEVGKSNAEKRWRKTQQKQRKADATAMPPQCNGNANSELRVREDTTVSSKDARATNREASRAFESWWERYPHKVGKPVAKKAYERALKRGVDPDELVRGLDRYVAGKPPDRAWCNPSTWLNQDRHADEPAPASTALVNGGRNGFGNRSRQPIDWERHAREFASDFARLNDRDPYGSNR